jgi:D-alanine-D-alanine ligase
MTKVRVGLLFGGRSVEHEVSLASATSIHRALDPTRYDVKLLAVDREGHWHLGTPELPPEASVRGALVSLPAAPGERTLVTTAGGSLEPAAQLDVIFPIIHGRGGEDGSLQGLLELAGVPYVGSGVLGSALQMDKETAKRLLRAAGLPVLPWVLVRKADLERRPEAEVSRALREIGLPLFVKPANQGSSVGISRVREARQLLPALREAARYDTKILCERAADAREIEVALIGIDPIEASVPGEIRTRRDFYDYEAKYVDEDTELIVPAPLDEEASEEVRSLAIRAMQVLEGEGLARVDFLLERETGRFFVNEVNSLPGFTDVSMFPRLWEASGLAYPALLDRLIELAFERHRSRAELETVYRRPEPVSD